MADERRVLDADDQLRQARHLMAQSRDDPDGALAGAVALLRQHGLDPQAAAIARTAAAQAAMYLRDFASAERHVRQAVRGARRHCSPPDLGRALLVRGPLLMERDRLADARRCLDEAADLLVDPSDLVRLTSYRALLAYLSGRAQDALELNTRLLEQLGADGVPSTRWAISLHNRALVLGSLQRYDEARADLTLAADMFAALDHLPGVHAAQVHLGKLAAEQGDVVRALEHFAQAGGAEGAAEDDPQGLTDFCAALLAARLLPEALDTAAQAAAVLAGRGSSLYRSRALLFQAEAALLLGDVEQARRAAAEARSSTGRGSSRALRALAALVVLRCDLASGSPDVAVLTRARRLARTLDDVGLMAEALDARILTARLATDLGRTAVARHLLDLDADARRRGPVELRCRAWHAEARLRLADGDRRGAQRAVRRGLAVLDAQRATLGTAELRATVAGHGADLARLGQRLAVEDGDAASVLRAAERWRAAALLIPAGIPDDLAADLTRLREVTAALRAATLSGGDTSRLRSRHTALEAVVRRRSRLVSAPNGTTGAPRPGLDVAALRQALGERVLVEFVDTGGRLLAVTTAADLAPRLHDLGDLATAAHEVRSLHLGLRLLGGGGPAPMVARAPALLADAAGRLDEQLFGRLSEGPRGRAVPGGRPLVVVPTGALHAVPWALLPTCVGRAVTAAPSASLWWRGATRDATRGTGSTPDRVVLVAGPDLRHAEDEIERLSALYPSATVLTGKDATVDAVLAALDGARLAHVASHGTFRADNPLFSSLRLADGPLTVYDLQRLRHAPDLTVLSACDVGLSDVGLGDEVLGVVAALLGLGGSSLVASSVPVRDAAVPELMERLHRHLLQGRPVSQALALARAVEGAGGATDLGTSGMSCFGVG